MAKMLRHAVVMVSVVLAFGAETVAAPPPTYKVRIHNQTGVDVRIKSIGYYEGEDGDNPAYYSDDYATGQSRKITGFYGGERVFIAWDDVNEQVVAVLRIKVTGNAHIWIWPNWYDGTYHEPTADQKTYEQVQNDDF